MVRTYVPMGPTPIRREWWPRAHLSAIGAISPDGQRYCQSQSCALDSVEVVTCLEHLRREMSGRRLRIWDGAPIQRRHVMQEL